MLRDDTPAWLLDANGCHVKRADWLDQLADDIAEQRNLFDGDDFGGVLNNVLTNDGDDHKTVSVAKVREAMREMGLS